jgi:Kef-type K+ transport system membrane component KefB
MLSISSTSIIIKSFDDMKLKQQKFTSTVTAVLVVEDLVAVLLLVVLSTVSVSQNFDGGALVGQMAKLAFFLVAVFIFGIYLIPTFLRWMRKYMSEETLLILAVGLCFGMVVLASKAGFSTALGAFVMGAVLSETIEADVIHRIVTPLKNLFSAVFFVSVGMLIQPSVLVEEWLTILVIAGTAWSCTMVLWVAPRIFRKAWFERAIAEFGQAMGVTATGLLLLRTVDPDNRTPAAMSFGYKQLLHEPFMGGGIWTALALTLVYRIGWLSTWLICLVMLTVWCVVALSLWRRNLSIASGKIKAPRRPCRST